jgi:hypothetical protein
VIASEAATYRRDSRTPIVPMVTAGRKPRESSKLPCWESQNSTSLRLGSGSSRQMSVNRRRAHWRVPSRKSARVVTDKSACDFYHVVELPDGSVPAAQVGPACKRRRIPRRRHLFWKAGDRDWPSKRISVVRAGSLHRTAPGVLLGSGSKTRRRSRATQAGLLDCSAAHPPASVPSSRMTTIRSRRPRLRRSAISADGIHRAELQWGLHELVVPKRGLHLGHAEKRRLPVNHGCHVARR